jgi:hypothetical protein
MQTAEQQKESQSKHYRNNKGYYADRNARRRKLFAQIIRDAKNVPCMDCGRYYPPCVMDFDHRGDKKFSIGNVANASSEADLRNEISKCDVVCANCHRIRTHILPDGVTGNTADFESVQSRFES